jgi:hypothetical protein
VKRSSLAGVIVITVSCVNTISLGAVPPHVPRAAAIVGNDCVSAGIELVNADNHRVGMVFFDAAGDAAAVTPPQQGKPWLEGVFARGAAVKSISTSPSWSAVDNGIDLSFVLDGWGDLQLRITRGPAREVLHPEVSYVRWGDDDEMNTWTSINAILDVHSAAVSGTLLAGEQKIGVRSIDVVTGVSCAANISEAHDVPTAPG